MTTFTWSDRGVSVETTVAGFIVWLARQHLASEHRWSCTRQVDQFLRWQQQRRAEGLDHHDDAYYAYLRATGAGDILVGEARTAIARLRQYLRTTT